jgi:Fe-S cluster assembly iron-binding protein IscA
MIAVTDRAKQELKRILYDKVDMPQARLRLTTGNGGELGLGIDIELPGDQIVEYMGSRLLVVEPGLAVNLRGIILDVDDTPQGPQLVIDEQKRVSS